VAQDPVDLSRDAELVARFQSGDEDAFVELFRLYFIRLSRYCARRMGDAHDGEEIAQEAFARALVALPRLAGERRFYPWLCVIASNLCMNALARRARMQVGSIRDRGEYDRRLEELVDGVDRALLRAALTKLATRDRAALEVWANGGSSAAIADRLGCSTATADVAVHRARRRFRDRFLALNRDEAACAPAANNSL